MGLTLCVLAIVAIVCLTFMTNSYYAPNMEGDGMHRKMVAENNAHFYLSNTSPKNQPSNILTESEEREKEKTRTIYGGKKDKVHLGGFLHDVDVQGISPNLWNFMMSQLAVKSLVDVGCGKGWHNGNFLVCK